MSAELVLVIVLIVPFAAAAGFLFSHSRSNAAQASLRQELEATKDVVQALDLEVGDKERLIAERDKQLQRQEIAVRLAEERLGNAEKIEARLRDEEQGHLERVTTVEVERNQVKESLVAVQSDLASERRRNQERTETIDELRAELAEQRKRVTAVEQERNELSKKLATTEVAGQKKEEHFVEQLEQLEKSEKRLKDEFKTLAGEILQSTGKAFTEQNKTQLDALLNPFQRQISEFKGKVESLGQEGVKQQAEMKAELKNLQVMHQKMTQEAENLATALQGQKKVQGNWGEMVLENVLDRSGLELGKDYKREVSFTDEEGGRSRPDAVVYLPQRKHLIIDAKVSLAAYTRYVNAEDDLERQQALKHHVLAVSERIKELSGRDYYKLKELNSPEIVFMFIPIESAYVEAFKADEGLFQKALEQSVLVTTPTTLLTSLNIVRQLWRFENQNEHTAELADKASRVYDKLRLFVESMEGVNKSLESARDGFDKAYAQLYTGRGNLVKQASEFQKLGVAVKTELPSHIVDRAELELSHQSRTEDPPALEASGETGIRSSPENQR